MRQCATRRFLVAGSVLVAAGAGCSNPAEVSECHGNVEVTVTPGPAPVFNWAPDCGLSFLTVLDRGDQSQGYWDVSAASPENTLVPPITFGVTPKGASGQPPNQPLRAGGAYLVRVFRIQEQSDGSFLPIEAGERAFNQ
jgi:hypothetical protein